MKDKVYGNDQNFSVYMLENVRGLVRRKTYFHSKFSFFADITKTLYRIFGVVEFQLTRSIIKKGNKGTKSS